MLSVDIVGGTPASAASSSIADWLGPLGGVAGQIFGGLIGNRGQADANASNERIARENRAFQERMSSTAYQRAATDLSAAGLNRILALGSPASSPGGSTAVMQNAKAPLGQAVSSATTTALNLKSQLAQIKNIEADSDLKKAMADQATQNTSSLVSSKRLSDAEASIKELGIHGVRTESEFYKWINENDLAVMYGVAKGATGWAGDILKGILKKAGKIK